MPLSPALLARLKQAVGPGAVLESEADRAPFERDWRGRFRGATPLREIHAALIRNSRVRRAGGLWVRRAA